MKRLGHPLLPAVAVLAALKDPSRCVYWSRELGLHSSPETIRHTLAQLAGDAGAAPRAMLMPIS